MLSPFSHPVQELGLETLSQYQVHKRHQVHKQSSAPHLVAAHHQLESVVIQELLGDVGTKLQPNPTLALLMGLKAGRWGKEAGRQASSWTAVRQAGVQAQDIRALVTDNCLPVQSRGWLCQHRTPVTSQS